MQLRQPVELVAALNRIPHREDKPHRIGVQTTSDKRQQLSRHLIQPLRVVDHAQHRPLASHIRQ